MNREHCPSSQPGPASALAPLRGQGRVRHVAQSDQPSGLHRGCHHSRVLDPGDGPRCVGSSLTPLNPQGRKQERAAFYTDFLLHFNEQAEKHLGKVEFQSHIERLSFRLVGEGAGSNLRFPKLYS